MKKTSGFTLVELVLAVVAVPVLMVAVVLVIDPAKIVEDGRNTQRIADVENILVAVNKYIADNNSVPLGITVNESQLGTDTDGCEIFAKGCAVTNGSCLNLQDSLSKYLDPIPMDPKIGTAGKTGYSISFNKDKKIIIKACGAEGLENIYTVY